MPTDKNGSPIDPVDAQIGGDGDIDGIAQTLTADDINAVLMSPQRKRHGTVARRH